jgi:hypothetical protein
MQLVACLRTDFDMEIQHSQLKLKHLSDTPSTKAVGGRISMVCLTRTSRYRSKRRSWLVPLLPTVLRNSCEVWDQEYKKKRMSKVDWEQYKESKDYTVKKPKLTDQKGKKREYCDSGWCKNRIDFYNEVRKRWKDIAFNNNLRVWSDLEKAWADYAEENDFGNVYS